MMHTFFKLMSLSFCLLTTLLFCTDNITIRFARNNDAPFIQELLNQLGYPLSEAHVLNRLERYSNSSTSKTFVAEVNGQIKGFVAITTFDVFLHNAQAISIGALVVDEQYRGKGLGKLLIKTVEEFGRASHCPFMVTTSSNDRQKTGAHDFYYATGFSSDHVLFEKMIPKNES